MRTTTAIAAAALVALSASACASGLPTGGAPAPVGAGSAATVSALPSAVPDTKAAVKAAADGYLALYSGGYWDSAWKLLAPADQKLAPEPLWAAFHQQCRPKAAGMAFEVASVTMSGKTGAVITYTIPALKKVYGSATNAMLWTPAGWRVVMDARAAAQYGHGGLKADVKAAEAAGDCASS